eukprot:c22833_g1_i2 orf=175-1059(+)
MEVAMESSLPAPASLPASSSGGNVAGEEEVRTLFVSGLPNDVKEREIYNLFRTHSGYESCQLKYTGRGFQIVAFAVFSDQASALAAKDILNGHKFDPQLGATLHIELARSNSRVKRPLSDERGPGAVEKKFRGPLGLSGVYQETGMAHSVYNDLSGFPPSQSGMMGAYGIQDGIPSMMMSKPLVPPPPAPGSNTPCSTLFVANLGLTTTEEELTQVMSRLPGFRKLKMQTKGGLPVAFVEFQDALCSTHAIAQLQDAILPSSDQGGIRLEYAKAKMGQPGRDRQRQLSFFGWTL